MQCADAVTTDVEALPRVRVQWTGVRRMHAADPFLQVHAASSAWTLPPPAAAAIADSLFFTESEYRDSPFVVRVVNNGVAFLHRGSHVVERSFVFPDRVLDAVVAHFDAATACATPSQSEPSFMQRNACLGIRDDPHKHGSGLDPHLCVLVRSDCVNIYTPRGDVFESALPFQANKLFAFGAAGLLLQRSVAPALPTSPTPRSRRSDVRDAWADSERALRPRFFTLAHPLDDVRPIALASAATATATAYISDPALDAVTYIAAHALLVCFDRHAKRFSAFTLACSRNASQPHAAPVLVVDAPIWRAHRARELEHDEHECVAIASSWIATRVWLSRPLRATATRADSNSNSNSSRQRSQQSAFVVSDVDGVSLLCVVDATVGVLQLKRLDDDRDDDDSSVETIECRAAVPLQLAATGDRDVTDMVVLHTDGRLRLHRGALAVCELVPPQDESDSNSSSGGRSWAPTTEIRAPAADDASSFEVCGHDAHETLYRCAHPLHVANEPLLTRVFDVLASALPAAVAIAVESDVVVESQRRHDVVAAGCSGDNNDSVELSGWRVFCDLLTRASERTQSSSIAAAEPLPPPSLAASAFDRLCQSRFHCTYSAAHPLLLANMQSLPISDAVARPVVPTLSAAQRSVSLLAAHATTAFAALHLLHEDLKLSVASAPLQQQLAALLLQLAARLDCTAAYCVYYEQETGSSAAVLGSGTDALARDRSTLFPGRRDADVADIVAWVNAQVHFAARSSSHPARFPVLATPATTVSSPMSPLWRTAAVCRVYELLLLARLPNSASQPRDGSDVSATLSNSADTVRTVDSDSRVALMAFLTQDRVGAQLVLSDLPFGVQFPVVDAISAFRDAPPPFVTADICAFIGREDLAGRRGGSSSSTRHHISSASAASHALAHTHSERYEPFQQQQSSDGSSGASNSASDGLDEVVQRSQALFPRDQRLKEVARLVRSSRPLCLKLATSSSAAEPDAAVQQQQARLLLLCKRAMALPVARGMVTLGSCDGHRAQHDAMQLGVPALPLTGRTPPTNAVVALDVSGYAKELTHWPQFHNGCAAALRLPARDLSTVVNRYWIKSHRPSVAAHQARAAASGRSDAPNATATNNSVSGTTGQSVASPEVVKRSLDESYAAHAGLLLGLGLRGHLKCLSMADVYNYLSLSNELVTVAILLGMAATAAHCRQQRKSESVVQQRPNAVPSVSTVSTSSDVSGLTDDDVDRQSLDAAAASRASPLVGSGLELTLERSVSKMLCLHIPSLLPPPFAEFSVPASTQTAALLGLGVLYQGTGHRLMAELLLTEIARSPSSTQFASSSTNAGLSTAAFDQLEGYALAAGLALGLVVLGRGQIRSSDPGLADMKLEEKLVKYMVGGAQQASDAAGTASSSSCLYRGRRWTRVGTTASSLAGNSSARSGSRDSREPTDTAARDVHGIGTRSNSSSGEHVNVSVTASGAALALAFMYMQTGNRSIASQLAVPATLVLLDAVRPDVLLVRTLAHNLVQWDSITPTRAWIDATQVPAQLLTAYTALQRTPRHASMTSVDVQSICEAYANIVAGACVSIGLRFASTRDAEARATLRAIVVHFRDLRGRRDVVATSTTRVTLERCLAACAQALALVDAGSGDVATLTLLRSINLRQRVDAELTFGHHMALSTAIGLLFLGGGRATVARSRDAVAALVVALFPMYPMHTADNKYHLQAFRHLYVLAVDTSRLLETIDVASGATCSVPVQLELQPVAGCLPSGASMVSGSSAVGRWQTLQTPCLLPEWSAIKRLVITSPAFYSVEILMAPPKQTQQQSTTWPTVSSSSALTANALRLELLRARNVVLLKRTKHDAAAAADATRTLELLQHHDDTNAAHSRVPLDDDDALLADFAMYFAGSGRRIVDKSPVKQWWHTQCQQLAAHPNVREDPTQFLTIHLHALHALFSLQQQSQSHSPMALAPSLAALRQLELFVAYCSLRAPSTTVSTAASDTTTLQVDGLRTQTAADDIIVWLRLETERALQTLWRACRTRVESLADVRALVARAATVAAHSSTDQQQQQQQQQTLDSVTTLVVRALVGHFAAPNRSLTAIARAPLLEHLGDKLSSISGSSAHGLEELIFSHVPSASTTHDKDSDSSSNSDSSNSDSSSAMQDDRTFWLQLMSFLFY